MLDMCVSVIFLMCSTLSALGAPLSTNITVTAGGGVPTNNTLVPLLLLGIVGMQLLNFFENLKSYFYQHSVLNITTGGPGWSLDGLPENTLEILQKTAAVCSPSQLSELQLTRPCQAARAGACGDH